MTREERDYIGEMFIKHAEKLAVYYDSMNVKKIMDNIDVMAIGLTVAMNESKTIEEFYSIVLDRIEKALIENGIL